MTKVLPHPLRFDAVEQTIDFGHIASGIGVLTASGSGRPPPLHRPLQVAGVGRPSAASETTPCLLIGAEHNRTTGAADQEAGPVNPQFALYKHALSELSAHLKLVEV